MTTSASEGHRAYYEQDEVWDPSAAGDPQADALRAEFVVERVLALGAGPVLDAGAGNGIIANRLHTLGVEVVAYDWSETAMAEVQAPKAVGDLRELPFGDRSFGVVVVSEVLEHIGPEYDLVRAELARVTGAAAIVTVPNDEDLVAEAIICPACECRSSPFRHVRRFDPADLADALPGFTATEVTAFGPADVRRRAWEAVIRRDLLRRTPWSPTALCPQCGFSAPGSPAPPARRRRAAWLVRPLRHRKRRWLGAVLRRAGS